MESGRNLAEKWDAGAQVLAFPDSHTHAGASATLAIRLVQSGEDAALNGNEYAQTIRAHMRHFTRLVAHHGPLLQGAGTADGGLGQVTALHALRTELRNIATATDTALRYRDKEQLGILAQHLRTFLVNINEYVQLEEASAALLVEALLLGHEKLQLEARLGLADAARWRGRPEESLGECLAAEGLAQALDDSRTLAVCLRKLHTVHYTRGEFALAETLLEKSQLCRGGEADDYERCTVLACFGSLDYVQGRYAAAREKYETALDAQLALGDLLGAASTVTNLGMVEYMLSNYQESQKLLEDSMTMRSELANRDADALALNSLGNTVYRLGELEAARDYYSHSLALRLEIGDRRGESIALNNLGNLAIHRRDYPAAQELYRRALELKRELGEKDGEARALINLGNLEFVQGNYDAALDRYRQAIPLSHSAGDPHGEAVAQMSSANAELFQGRASEAVGNCASALASFRHLGNKAEAASACSTAGLILARLGHYGLAVVAVHGSRSCAEAIGYHFGADDEPVYLAGLAVLDEALASGALSRYVLDENRQLAEALELDELTHFVLRELAQLTP